MTANHARRPLGQSSVRRTEESVTGIAQAGQDVSPEEMQKAYEDVTGFNADLQTEGHGCSPAVCVRPTPPPS